ncbi:uncharacterized protein [Nicotiana sylvestris]|uniref:uncharacterized protein n=1 Tax=Nicotiana sylvestris TaxID=4096 RepID=UPI00388C879A
MSRGKKKEETSIAASEAREYRNSRPRFPERTPQYYYPHKNVTYAPQPYMVMNTQPYVQPPQQANRGQAPPPRNQPPYRNHYNPQPPQNNFCPQEPPRRRTFTPIGEPYSTLFPMLVQMGFLQLVPQTRHNPASPAYKAGVRVVENLIEQGKIVLRDEEVLNVTNNLLPTHNNGSLIGMICEDKEFDPALKAIIAIVDAGKKPKTALKLEKGEKKISTIMVELEEKIETKTVTMVPAKNEVLYIPRGRSEKPQRFEVRRAKPMYVSKGAYVVRGTIKPPWLNEPVVIGCVPQKPMTDPSTVPWNYQRTLVTYKGREVMGELPENTFVGKYSDTQELNNATRKRFPPKKPVSVEEAEVFFQKMKMPDYEVVDQLRKCPEQVSILSLLMRSAEHQKILLKTLNEAYIPAETSVQQLERMTERFFAVNQIAAVVTARFTGSVVVEHTVLLCVCH